MRLLVVENDPESTLTLEVVLRREGFSVTLARTGEEGLCLLDTQRFDLLLLNWILPGGDGLEILKAARAGSANIPILLLSENAAIAHGVLAFESGADDYLVKPFAFAELVARIRSLLRRDANSHPLRWQIADLSIDLQFRAVARGGRRIDLTRREFAALTCLMRHSGEVVTRRMLARAVWPEVSPLAPLDNVIDVNFARLRRKVDGGQPTTLIQTVRGVGFILREEPRTQA